MRKRNRKPSAAALVAAWCLLAPLLAPALAAGKKKSKIVPQAILFGNVFQESGLLLRGARVVVTSAQRPKARMETTTDIQGEFAVRVPAGKATYTIEVAAPGFHPEKKTVEIAADERIDLTFRLAPAGK